MVVMEALESFGGRPDVLALVDVFIVKADLLLGTLRASPCRARTNTAGSGAC